MSDTSLKKIIRLGLGSSVISSFSIQLSAMLVNSKEIAENVKTAIVEAGEHVSSNFKDVIETSKPVWPNKYSCLTALGIVCATGGLFLLYSGILQIINTWGRTDENLSKINEDAYSGKRGFAKLVVGLIVCAVGISAIYIFGG